MNEQERNALKQKIIELIEGKRKEIASLEKSTQPIAPDNAIGRLTRMEAINAKSVDEANLRAARIKLAQLQQALKKSDSPEFGMCSVCDEPIAVKRLLLMPESTRCVHCAE